MLVITDSAAAIPEDIQTLLGITTVPITLSVDGQPVSEDGTETQTNAAAPDSHSSDHSSSQNTKSNPTAKVTTSAPTPGSYLSVIDQPQAQDGCLIVTVSAKLSGCFQSATLAAGMAQVPVVVVDSQSAAGGQALVTIAAAQTLQASTQDSDSPNRLAQAAAAAKQVAAKVRLVGVLSEIDHLARTGRIPGWAAKVAGRLNVKPMFEISGGAIKRLLPTASIASAHGKILEQLKNSKPKQSDHDASQSAPPRLHVCAVHSQAPAAAESLLEQVRAVAEPASHLICSFGDALSAAAGPGVSGLAWWWEDENPPR